MDNHKDELQDYINHLTEFVAKLAPDGTVLMVNSALAELIDTPPDEIPGRKFWEIPLWVDANQKQLEMQTAVETAKSGQGTHFDFSYHTPEECYVIIALTVQPVLNSKGQISYIVVEGRDISERRLAEAVLRKSEERFRSIFENAPIGIFQATIDGRFILVNNTFARAFDYQSPEEIISAIPKNFPESLLVHADRWPEIVRTVIASDGFCRFENEHRRRDGSTFIANVYVRAVREGERVLLFEGFEEDISARVLAQQKLSDEKKLNETIINSFPGLFYMINEQGKLIWWNEYRDRNFEFQVDEQGYSEVLSYVLETDRPLAADAIKRAFQGEQTSVELRLPHKDGQVRDYYCTGARVDIGGEPRIVGVAVDITSRKRAEEEKRDFYHETVKSVTQGKLDLAQRKDLQEFVENPEYAMEIAHAADVATARSELHTFYASKGLGGDDLREFIAGIGEAMTNAIKHAGFGTVYAGVRLDCIWATVSDQGPGIATLTLPGATLRRGFSTIKSLGMGYSIMLDSSDRIFLSTGPDGTTVVLTKDIVEPEYELCLSDLPDTWNEAPIA